MPSLPNILMAGRLALLAMFASVTALQAGESHIDIRLSFKLLKDAGEGPNPSATTQNINAMLTTANEVMDRQQRGYRFVVSEVVEVDPNLPLPKRTYYITSNRVPRDLQMLNFYRWWADSDPIANCDQALPPFLGYRTVDQQDLETIDPSVELDGMFFEVVKANRTEFKFRDDQANVYVIWGLYCGGRGDFPACDAANHNMFLLSGIGDVSLFLHEFGHYANLHHPFETVESISRNAVGTEPANPGDVPDTPPDAWWIDPIPPDTNPPNARWSPLALRFYNVAYASLGVDEKMRVRKMDKIGQLRNLGTDPYSTAEIEELWLTWVNLMSYHKGEPPVEDWRFSEMQLDIMTDALSQPEPCGRASIAGGLTWFVSSNGFVGGQPNTSTHPYPLASALASVTPLGGDILLLRNGAYNVQPVLNKPMTLRVARGTRATLGSATPH